MNFSTPQNLTMNILCDAVKDKKIPTEFLYSIINLSNQKQKISSSSLETRMEDGKLKKEQVEKSKHDVLETTQQRSKKKVLIQKKIKHYIKEENHSQSHFEVAAANAITILNMTGFDFSHCDLSNVSMMGANLSYGAFEGTTFANANLQNVNFTGAWLKNASFERANLQGVDFGEDSDLNIWDDLIAGIAYSQNGRYLAVDNYDQTMIYEKSGQQI